MATSLPTTTFSNCTVDVNLSSCYSTTEQKDEDKHDFNLGMTSMAERMGVSLILIIIELTVVGGNLLVCVIIFTDQQVKIKIANLYLASLAGADLLVAILVMTFAIASDLYGQWTFGHTFCLIWIACDVMCTTASILNLALICINRFAQIKHSIWYLRNMTKRKILALIITTWVISFFLSFVPILAEWHAPKTTPNDANHCLFVINLEYAVISSMISYYIPCIVILALYTRIFCVVRSMSKAKLRIEPLTLESGSAKGPQAVPSKAGSPKSVPSKAGSPQAVPSKAGSLKSVPSKAGSPKSVPNKAGSLKAAVVLGLVVGAFLLCWLPFFIINPIRAYCGTCIPTEVFYVSIWLGYFNSCVNPFIYSHLTPEFRKAFYRKLKLCTKKKR